MNTTTIIAAIVVFLVIIFLLVALLLWAKAKLTTSGPVTIKINGEKEITVEAGSTLLTTLGNNQLFLPSACGGGGTCAMCKCQVIQAAITEAAGGYLPCLGLIGLITCQTLVTRQELIPTAVTYL